MKRELLFIYLIVMMTITTDANAKMMTCIIKGEVIGRNSKTIIILKATDDIQSAQSMIPINDNTFQYKLETPQTEAHLLIFKDELDNGAYKPIVIFPENGTINCKLYSMSEFEKNQVTGKLNIEFNNYQKSLKNRFITKYQPLQDSMMALRKRNEYYNQKYYDEMSRLRTEMKDTNTETRMKITSQMADLSNSGNYLSQKGKLIEEKRLELNREIYQEKYNYISKNPSLLTYYLILEDLKFYDSFKELINIEDIKKNHRTLSTKFPDHPYYNIVKELINSRDNIKIGGSFVDFSLPDLNGNFYRLSDIINGKIALIDLWSTWCGPCIQTSRSMLPVYEKYKDLGFTICAVAADKNNTDRIVKITERERFPWINLVDLDHKNKIWYKYGIPNAGGMTVLIDKDGKILAIHPSTDELRKILNEKLINIQPHK